MVWWRRRWPERDLGSVDRWGGISIRGLFLGRGVVVVKG